MSSFGHTDVFSVLPIVRPFDVFKPWSSSQKVNSITSLTFRNIYIYINHKSAIANDLEYVAGQFNDRSKSMGFTIVVRRSRCAKSRGCNSGDAGRASDRVINQTQILLILLY